MDSAYWKEQKKYLQLTRKHMWIRGSLCKASAAAIREKYIYWSGFLQGVA